MCWYQREPGGLGKEIVAEGGAGRRVPKGGDQVSSPEWTWKRRSWKSGMSQVLSWAKAVARWVSLMVDVTPARRRASSMVRWSCV